MIYEYADGVVYFEYTGGAVHSFLWTRWFSASPHYICRIPSDYVDRGIDGLEFA